MNQFFIGLCAGMLLLFGLNIPTIKSANGDIQAMQNDLNNCERSLSESKAKLEGALLLK